MAKPFPTLTIRWTLFAAAIVCYPSVVVADPIVLSNRSGARGFVSIADGAQVLASSNFQSPPATTIGTFSFADSATVSAAGATSTTTSDIMTVISPTHFSATGTVTGLTSQDGTISSAVNSGTFAAIDFVLSESYVYTYRGEFLLETAGERTTLTLRSGLDLVVGLSGTQPIFTNIFATTAGGVVVPPGSHVVEQTGVVEPGRYVLSAGLASMIQTATLTTPNQRASRLGFDTSFSLTPVPEPATLGLLTTGLVCLGGWRKRRRLVN
jgi:hypothetical protein